MNKKWFCFYRFVNTHLEYIMDTKEEAQHWLDFWHGNPRCWIAEIACDNLSTTQGERCE